MTSPKDRLLAFAAVSVLLLSAATGARLSSGPAASVAAFDPKLEAQTIITDVRNALDALSVRVGSASGNVSRLTVSGSTKARDSIQSELLSISDDIETLDAKLLVLDARVSSLSTATSTRKNNTSSASATSSSAGASSGSFKVACEVSDRTVGVAETVQFRSVVSGGSGPYSYAWSGAFEGNGSTQNATLVDRGTYKETLTVTDRKGKKLSDECPSVEVDKAFANGAGDSATRAKKATITLLAPAAGAKLKSGSPATINWRYSGLASADLIDVYLTDGGDGIAYYVASTLDKGADGKGSYTWASPGTVANAFMPYGSYTLRVCTTDHEVCAASSVTIQKP